MKIYFVVPDYYANRPKKCMNGWGTTFLNITADGLALPCHEARMLPGLTFPNVRDHDLRWIWDESPGFNAYRGDDWMKEPCRTCPEKEKDLGRLPLPGLHAHRRCDQRRSGLRPVTAPRSVTDVVAKAQKPAAAGQRQADRVPRRPQLAQAEREHENASRGRYYAGGLTTAEPQRRRGAEDSREDRSRMRVPGAGQNRMNAQRPSSVPSWLTLRVLCALRLCGSAVGPNLS